MTLKSRIHSNKKTTRSSLPVDFTNAPHAVGDFSKINMPAPIPTTKNLQESICAAEKHLSATEEPYNALKAAPHNIIQTNLSSRRDRLAGAIALAQVAIELNDGSPSKEDIKNHLEAIEMATTHYNGDFKLFAACMASPAHPQTTLDI